MTKTITFIGTQGAGKSSTAINAVWAIDDILRGYYDIPRSDGSRSNHPVLLLDATPESTASNFCDVNRQADVYPMRKDDKIAGYVALTRKPKARAKDVERAKFGYETVYADTSSANPSQVDDIMKATDSIILITTPYETLDTWLDFLRRARDSNPHITLEQLVLNRFDKTSGTQQDALRFAKELISDDEKEAEKYVSTLPSSQDMRRLYDERVPAYIGDPALREVYERFAWHLLKNRKPLSVRQLVRRIEEKEGIPTTEEHDINPLLAQSLHFSPYKQYDVF